jgi:two-component system phosphate regulon sensor histidine kinase PhoR
MVELVDSLLNVSRIEVGRLRNEQQDTSMIELAESLEKELRTSIVSKHLKYDQSTAKHLPTVYADPKLLRIVLQNLLSNAVKYTPPKGSVTLTMRLAKSDDLAKTKLRHNQQYMFMSVADTGYGIPKNQQEKIFDKLFRADNVRKMETEGTGLGLYIIKEVVGKLGGVIWFNSVEGKGTTFYVIIPIKTRLF